MPETTQTAETTTKSRKGIGGPKTKEGRERVRLNALKLGLYAKSLEGMQAVADVIGVSFESIHQKMRDYYQPADPVEEALVRRIARCSWKLIAIETMEDHVLKGLALRSAPGPSLESLSVIERRTDIQLHRAISALAAKRRGEQRENVKNKLTGPPSPSVTHAQPGSEFVPSPALQSRLASVFRPVAQALLRRPSPARDTMIPNPAGTPGRKPRETIRPRSMKEGGTCLD